MEITRKETGFGDRYYSPAAGPLSTGQIDPLRANTRCRNRLLLVGQLGLKGKGGCPFILSLNIPSGLRNATGQSVEMSTMTQAGLIGLLLHLSLLHPFAKSLGSTQVTISFAALAQGFNILATTGGARTHLRCCCGANEDYSELFAGLANGAP